MSEGIYVQYGCGLCAPEGWENFDASLRLRFERLPGVGAVVGVAGLRLFPPNVAYGDIVEGLPVPDSGVRGIYASHVLEHLSRADVARALSNTLRVLQPGGLFRMVVPDLQTRATRYLRAHQAGVETAADDFIKSCNIGELESPRGPMGLLRSAFGHHGHAWMYDEPLMTRLLGEAGFVSIRRCHFNDSGDPMFGRVEEQGRFFDEGEPELAMEARKP